MTSQVPGRLVSFESDPVNVSACQIWLILISNRTWIPWKMLNSLP